jgi:hypothetical protein
MGFSAFLALPLCGAIFGYFSAMNTDAGVKHDQIKEETAVLFREVG